MRIHLILIRPRPYTVPLVIGREYTNMHCINVISICFVAAAVRIHTAFVHSMVQSEKLS